MRPTWLIPGTHKLKLVSAFARSGSDIGAYRFRVIESDTMTPFSECWWAYLDTPGVSEARVALETALDKRGFVIAEAVDRPTRSGKLFTFVNWKRAS